MSEHRRSVPRATPRPDERMAQPELRPLIFFDVDGTLTADRQQMFPFDYSYDYETYTVHTMGRSYPMLCRPDVLAAVNAASEMVEVRWLTMWGQNAANDFAPAVGLKHFEVSDRFQGAGYPDAGRWSLRWWKVIAILLEQELHPGRALIWLDNAISPDLHDQMIASQLTPSTLSWIQPKSTRGLDAEDLATLRSWLDDPIITRRIRRGTDYPEDESPIGGVEEHHGDQ